MRWIINVWTETEFNSFSVAIVAGRVVGSLTVCTPEGPVSYVVLSFIYSQEWERRVVTWVVDLLCCAVGQVASVGVLLQVVARTGKCVSCSVASVRSEKKPRGCERAGDGRHRRSFYIKSSSDEDEGVHARSSLIRVSQVAAGKYSLCSECRRISLYIC